MLSKGASNNNTQLKAKIFNRAKEQLLLASQGVAK
jgi:hypothetical protein